MKNQHNLSGIYFRQQNEDGKWDNVCFEDLEKQKQEEILKEKEPEFIKNLCLMLSDTLYEVAEKFEIFKD